MTLEFAAEFCTLIVALVGVVGLMWRLGRKVIRAIHSLDESLNVRIRRESVEALSEPRGVAALKLAAREAAAEALEGLAAPMMQAQMDHQRRIEGLEDSRKSQGARLGELEQWKGGAEVILQGVSEHGRRLGALERFAVVFGEKLSHIVKSDPEEPGS